MTLRRRVGTVLVAVVAMAALTPPAPTLAEPSSDEASYLDAVRGSFPGDDGTLLLVGKRMCHMLYNGESSSTVVAALAAEYGASTDQAGSALRAARSTLCAQAPG